MNQTSRTVKIAMFLAGALYAHTASADNVPANRQITELRTFGAYAAIKISPVYANNLSCTSTIANEWVVIDWSVDSNAKFMYAAALSAYIQGQSVGFGILGCNPKFGGGTGVPQAYRVTLPPNQ